MYSHRLLVVDLWESLRHQFMGGRVTRVLTLVTPETLARARSDLCCQLTLCSKRSRTQHMLWRNIFVVCSLPHLLIQGAGLSTAFRHDCITYTNLSLTVMADLLQCSLILDPVGIYVMRFPVFLGLSQLSTISALEKLGNIVSKIRRADNARRQHKVT